MFEKIKETIRTTPKSEIALYLVLGVLGVFAVAGFTASLFVSVWIAVGIGAAFAFGPFILAGLAYAAWKAAQAIYNLIKKSLSVSVALLGILLFLLSIFLLPFGPIGLIFGALSLGFSLLASTYFWKEPLPTGAQKFFFTLALSVFLAVTLTVFLPILGAFLLPGIAGVIMLGVLAGIFPFFIWGGIEFFRAVRKSISENIAFIALLIGIGLFILAAIFLPFLVGLPFALGIGAFFTFLGILWSFSAKNWKDRTPFEKFLSLLSLGLLFAGIAVFIAMLISPLGLFGIGVLGFAAIGAMAGVVPFLAFGIFKLGEAIYKASAKIKAFFVRVFNFVVRVFEALYFLSLLLAPLVIFLLLSTLLPLLPVAIVALLPVAPIVIVFAISALLGFLLLFFSPGFTKLTATQRTLLVLGVGIVLAVIMGLFLPFLAAFLLPGIGGVLALGVMIAFLPALFYGLVQIRDRIAKNAITIFTLIGIAALIVGVLFLAPFLPFIAAAALGIVFFLISFFLGLSIKTGSFEPKKLGKTLLSLSTTEKLVLFLGLGVVAGLIAFALGPLLLAFLFGVSIAPLALAFLVGASVTAVLMAPLVILKILSAIGRFIKNNSVLIALAVCIAGIVLAAVFAPALLATIWIWPIFAVVMAIGVIVKFYEKIANFFAAVAKFIREHLGAVSFVLGVALFVTLISVLPFTWPIFIAAAVVSVAFWLAGLFRSPRLLLATAFAATAFFPLTLLAGLAGITLIALPLAVGLFAGLLGFLAIPLFKSIFSESSSAAPKGSAVDKEPEIELEAVSDVAADVDEKASADVSASAGASVVVSASAGASPSAGEKSSREQALDLSARLIEAEYAAERSSYPREKAKLEAECEVYRARIDGLVPEIIKEENSGSAVFPSSPLEEQRLKSELYEGALPRTRDPYTGKPYERTYQTHAEMSKSAKEKDAVAHVAAKNIAEPEAAVMAKEEPASVPKDEEKPEEKAVEKVAEADVAPIPKEVEPVPHEVVAKEEDKKLEEPPKEPVQEEVAKEDVALVPKEAEKPVGGEVLVEEKEKKLEESKELPEEPTLVQQQEELAEPGAPIPPVTLPPAPPAAKSDGTLKEDKKLEEPKEPPKEPTLAQQQEEEKLAEPGAPVPPVRLPPAPPAAKPDGTLPPSPTAVPAAFRSAAAEQKAVAPEVKAATVSPKPEFKPIILARIHEWRERAITNSLARRKAKLDAEEKEKARKAAEEASGSGGLTQNLGFNP